MAKNILKEAIADAKAVREVALANAKAALEEAFTPRLQSMLSAKLSEELDEVEDKEEIEETYQEDDPRADKEMDETYMEEGEKEDLDEEIDLEEILSELELDEGDDSEEETVDEAKDEDLDEAKEETNEAKEEDLDEAKDDKEEEKIDEEMAPIYKADDVQRASTKAEYVNEDKEFDLDTLLEEINNLDETEEVEEGKSKYNDPHSSDEDIDFWKQYSEGETNEVVGTVAAGVAGLVAAAGGLSALEVAAEDPEWQAKYPKVASALKGLQNMGKMAGDSMRREQQERDTELEETKAALETVRTELNEVNLLNSKLLYVNRIFKANTLDEAQKLRVVETLDNADTIKEAKLIYETIKDTFNVAKSKKASFKSKTKSLKENFGMASNAAGTSTAPKKEILTESTDMISRFQKLANIKINQ
jgi:hypothetical protein